MEDNRALYMIQLGIRAGRHQDGPVLERAAARGHADDRDRRGPLLLLYVRLLGLTLLHGLRLPAGRALADLRVRRCSSSSSTGPSSPSSI
eukprot:156387-Prymnesium_polylepis.1